MDFDLIETDGEETNEIKNHRDELWDFPLHHSTPSFSRLQPAALPRPIDLPSRKKHYGLLTFLDSQLPIIYR